jgi:DNA replication protein DnaC
MASCPDGRCDGSGFLFDEAARRARPCSCRPRLLARKRAAAIEGRIPRRYRGVSFDREPLIDIARTHPEAIRRTRRYINTLDEQIDAGRGLWFTGSPGTGKTTLAMLISRSAIEAGRSVAIYSLPHLLALLRDTYNDGGPNLVELIDRLAAVELLHIDDIGAEQSSPWVLEQLYTIINSRYEDERALILTTNLVPATPEMESRPRKRRTSAEDEGEQEPPTLDDQLGNRIVSRICEICGDPIGLFGPDHRKGSDFDPEDAEINWGAIGKGPPIRNPLSQQWEDSPPSYGEQRPRRQYGS